RRFKALGKRSTIMIVAEGDEYGGAYKTMEALKQAGAPYEMRAVVLGHVMRGGTPVPLDRIWRRGSGVSPSTRCTWAKLERWSARLPAS
ncbi:MAG: 6-phosphofructokinase, partial [Thermoguttaceae bacterium]|nr:6-phosphofructokinase [Thermoguttaceae bacterium]